VLATSGSSTSPILLPRDQNVGPLNPIPVSGCDSRAPARVRRSTRDVRPPTWARPQRLLLAPIVRDRSGAAQHAQRPAEGGNLGIAAPDSFYLRSTGDARARPWQRAALVRGSSPRASFAPPQDSRALARLAVLQRKSGLAKLAPRGPIQPDGADLGRGADRSLPAWGLFTGRPPLHSSRRTRLRHAACRAAGPARSTGAALAATRGGAGVGEAHRSQAGRPIRCGRGARCSKHASGPSGRAPILTGVRFWRARSFGDAGLLMDAVKPTAPSDLRISRLAGLSNEKALVRAAFLPAPRRR
jgi:hypothetical protein